MQVIRFTVSVNFKVLFGAVGHHENILLNAGTYLETAEWLETKDGLDHTELMPTLLHATTAV